jgi:hypothetical protein
MTIEERIEQAQRKAKQSADSAQQADDEARGCEAIGLTERAERCRDRELGHTENAAVYSATARKLREQQETTNAHLATERQREHVSPGCAADGSAYAETQAHQLDAERNEALGLAAAS